jgi:hypothetical protein
MLCIGYPRCCWHFGISRRGLPPPGIASLTQQRCSTRSQPLAMHPGQPHMRWSPWTRIRPSSHLQHYVFDDPAIQQPLLADIALLLTPSEEIPPIIFMLLMEACPSVAVDDRGNVIFRSAQQPIFGQCNAHGECEWKQRIYPSAASCFGGHETLFRWFS